MARLVFLLSIPMILVGCNREDRPCGSFSRGYKRIENLQDLPNFAMTAAVLRARDIVKRCYKEHPYRLTDRVAVRIKFMSAKYEEDGNVYVTYDVLDTSDTSLAFRIDAKGNVDSVYRYSSFG
jgi:hypothetical protein